MARPLLMAVLLVFFAVVASEATALRHRVRKADPTADPETWVSVSRNFEPGHEDKKATLKGNTMVVSTNYGDPLDTQEEPAADPNAAPKPLVRKMVVSKSGKNHRAAAAKKHEGGALQPSSGDAKLDEVVDAHLDVPSPEKPSPEKVHAKIKKVSDKVKSLLDKVESNEKDIDEVEEALEGEEDEDEDAAPEDEEEAAPEDEEDIVEEEDEEEPEDEEDIVEDVEDEAEEEDEAEAEAEGAGDVPPPAE